MAAVEKLLGKATNPTPGSISSWQSCHGAGSVSHTWGSARSSRAPSTMATHISCWHRAASKTTHLQLSVIKAHPRVTGFPRNPTGFPRNSANAQICHVLQ